MRRRGTRRRRRWRAPANLACLFIRTINQERYGPLKTKLANDWAFGEDSYPKTVAKVFQLIEKWEDEHGSKSSKGKTGDDEEVGVGFVQQGLPKAAKADINCYGCGKKGQYGWECPNSSEEKKKALYSEEAKKKELSRPGRSR